MPEHSCSLSIFCHQLWIPVLKYKNTKTLGFVFLLRNDDAFRPAGDAFRPAGDAFRPAAKGGRYHKIVKTILFFCLFLKFLVFFSKSFNTSGCIHQFLFTGKKRMALGADLNTDIFAGGAHRHNIAAGAFNICFRILRMNIRFHFFQPPVKRS